MPSGFLKRKLVHDRVSALRDRMFRTAYAWCNNRALAQDLAQEAALKAIEKATQLREISAIDAWVFSILANCHRTWLRRTVATTEFDETEMESLHLESIPEQTSDSSRLIEQVKSAIAELNEEQRKVITLVDIEEFSYAEVASILEIPIGTVMSRLSRARQQLKKKIAQATGIRQRHCRLSAL